MGMTKAELQKRYTALRRKSSRLEKQVKLLKSEVNRLKRNVDITENKMYKAEERCEEGTAAANRVRGAVQFLVNKLEEVVDYDTGRQRWELLGFSNLQEKMYKDLRDAGRDL